MLLYAVEAACSLLLPYIMGNIVNVGIYNGDVTYIWTQGVLMLVIALVYLGVSLISNKVSSVMVPKFSKKLRLDAINKVNSFSFEQFSKMGTGSLITRLTDDIDWIEDTAGQLPYIFVMVPIMFFGGVIMTLLSDWVLAVILLAVSPVVLVIAGAITRGMNRRWDEAEKFVDIQNKVIRERLSGVRVIRAFDKDASEHRRTADATREMCRHFIRNNTLSNLVSPIAQLLLNVATVAIIYIGATRLQTINTLRAGDIVAAIQYIALIGNAIIMLAWTMSFLPRVGVSIGRIDQILDMPIAEVNDGSTVSLSGDIKFDNVSFSYPVNKIDGVVDAFEKSTATDTPAQNALSDINIDIKEGEIVGIIGGTGSGKTTLMKLLLAFYSGTTGERYIGGVNYNDINSSAIRDNVSIALQKSMIFEGTIKENILMGNKDATDDQIAAAVNISQLDNFVAEHEEGLDYALNQSGSNISGGQKQRINIARAILKDASVYIFDDSFSALDYFTERNLRQALNKKLDGKTQIIITQRAATAMRCDKVYVMDQGKIVGNGTHKQLLKSCNIYREIYDSQLGGNVGGKA
jgi:ATP-binding cassette subfamily B protein